MEREVSIMVIQNRSIASVRVLRTIRRSAIGAALAALLLFALTACDDAINKPSSSITGAIRPPAWIQGDWDLDYLAGNVGGQRNSTTRRWAAERMTFTEDDVFFWVGSSRILLSGMVGTWSQTVDDGEYALVIRNQDVEMGFRWTRSVDPDVVHFVSWMKTDSLVDDPAGAYVYERAD